MTAAPGACEAAPGWDDGFVDARTLGKLKWRCRRGLLENDLIIERYFRRHEASITNRQAHGLLALMDLPDNDLLDLLLGRTQLACGADIGEPAAALEMLALLRQRPESRTTERPTA